MELSEIKVLTQRNQEKAKDILTNSNIIGILENAGLRVNIIGSLRMGLLVNHKDIDLHVYSSDITIEKSFSIMSSIAAIPNIVETRCINGLGTQEKCVEWHFYYRDNDDNMWQIDIIHIENGSQYDGYFEKMADRIIELISPQQKDTILKLKYLSNIEGDIHGSEIYEAVMSEGIADFKELKDWVKSRRKKEPYFWMP